MTPRPPRSTPGRSRILLAFLAGTVGCRLPLPPARAATGTEWTRIEHDASFKGWEEELHRIVHRDATGPHNEFCVVVDRPHPGDADARAYVYWRQRHRLITWGASDDEINILDEIGAPLDLRRDVVPDRAAVGTSTVLVTRAWVDRILSACRRYGTTLTLDHR